MARASGAPRDSTVAPKNCSEEVRDTLAQLAVRPPPPHLRGDATTYQLAVEVHAAMRDWPACIALFWQLHSVGYRERSDKPLPTEFYIAMIEAAATCRVQLVEQVEQVLQMALKSANSTRMHPKSDRTGVVVSSGLLRSMLHFYLSAGALPAALAFFNAWSDGWSSPPGRVAPSATLGQSVRSRLLQAVRYSRPAQPDPPAYGLLLRACAKTGKTNVAHALLQLLRNSAEHVKAHRRSHVILRPEMYMHAMNAWNQRAIIQFHDPPLIRKAPVPESASPSPIESPEVDALPSMEQLDSEEDSSIDSTPLPELGPVDLSQPCTAAEYSHMHVSALWREMSTRGIPQDEGVYNAMLLSAALAGKVDEVHQLVDTMEAAAATATAGSAADDPAVASSQSTPSDTMENDVRVSLAPSPLTYAHAYIACAFESSARSLSRAGGYLARMESLLPLRDDDATLTKPVALARFDRLQSVYIHMLPLLSLKQQVLHGSWALHIVSKLEAQSDALQARFNSKDTATTDTEAVDATANSVHAPVPSTLPAPRASDFLVSRAVYQLAMDSCEVSYHSERCVQLFRSLFRRGVRPDASIYTTLLRGLVRCRDWSGALEVLAFVEGQSEVTLGLDSWKRVQPLMAGQIFPPTAASTRDGGFASSSVPISHARGADFLRELSIAQDLLRLWRSNGSATSPSSSSSQHSSGSPMSVQAFYSPERAFVPDHGRSGLRQQALPALSPFLKDAYTDSSSLLAPLLQTILPPPNKSVLQALRDLVQEKIDEKAQST